MQPELYYKTTLTSDAERCYSLCSTKHVQSFVIWQWAVNLVNLDKKVKCPGLIDPADAVFLMRVLK